MTQLVPKQSASIVRWIIFIMTFSAFIFVMSSTLAKNIETWFKTTVKSLTFQFACNENPFPNPQDIVTTAQSPFVSQLNKNKTFKYNLGLADFYILGSAKSYQLGGDTQSIPSYDAIKDVLLRGARAIELDIFGGYKDETIPVVRGYKPTLLTMNNYLELDKCFNVIANEGFKKPFNDYPLIVYLNIYSNNRKLMDNVAEFYLKHLADRMINSRKYGHASVEPEYIMMDECKGKSVLIVNTTHANIIPTEESPLTPSTELNNVINGYLCLHKDEKKANREILNIALDDTTDITTAYNKSMNNKEGQLNLSNLIEFNRTKLSISSPTTAYDWYNVVKQGSDLKSYDILNAQINGCQINLFHFNKIDENFNRAIYMFKDGPVQLRPQYLRKMPKEGVDYVKANPATSSMTKQIDVLYQGGRFNHFGNF